MKYKWSWIVALPLTLALGIAVGYAIKKDTTTDTSTSPHTEAMKVNEKPGDSSFRIDRQSLYSLINLERSKSGLPALIPDARLEFSACAKSNDMVSQNYWAHISPNGTDPHGTLLNEKVYFIVRPAKT